MDYSATFARHFSRLAWLLTRENANLDEQKVALRALATVSRSGDVTLALQDGVLVANGNGVAGALAGVADVSRNIAGLGVKELRVAKGTKPADLLALARVIASGPGGEGKETAVARIAVIKSPSIEFVFNETAAAAAATSAAAEADTEPSPIAPPNKSKEPQVQDAPPSDPPIAEQPIVEPPPPEREKRRKGEPESGRKREPDSGRKRREKSSGERSDPTALIAQLNAPDMSKVKPEELFAALDSAKTLDETAAALDAMARLAEYSMRSGKQLQVATVLHGAITREGSADTEEKGRAFANAIRRLSKAPLLRSVASQIPRRPEKRQQLREILARMGEDGAEAVIEQISQAQTAADRKTLLEVLGGLDAVVPALKRMLGDSRWFVVRNSADLLGELRAKEADDALVALLRHSDDRVRRAATNALLRLGTPDALKGIYEAMSDSSPEVRLQATAAISTRKDGKTAVTLIRAIEDEDDVDVQLAIIGALGRVATADAVQKLIRMAEPPSGLFRKKVTATRVAAVNALAEARTPPAISALRALTGDKEREVRETATRLLAQLTG